MKKLLVLVMTVAMLMGLAACTTPAADSSAPASAVTSDSSVQSSTESAADKLKIVAVIPFTANQFWDEDVRGGLERAAADADVDFTYIATESLDNNKWLEALETAIADGADGVITFVLNADALVDIKASLGDKPLISIVSAADCVDVCVGTNDYQAGKDLGQVLIDKTGGTGTVGVMTGQLDDASLNLRLEGLKEVLNAAGMTIAAIDEDRADISTGVQKVEAMLLAHPEIDCLVGVAGNNAPEFAQVLTEQGKVDQFTVVGFDNLEQTLDAVRNGTIYATLVQRQYYAGYEALMAAVDIINGVARDHEFDTGTAILTMDNVDTYDPTVF